MERKTSQDDLTQVRTSTPGDRRENEHAPDPDVADEEVGDDENIPV